MIDATYYSTPLDEDGNPLIDSDIESRYKLSNRYSVGTQVESIKEDIAYDELYDRSTKKWLRCPTCFRWTAKLKLSNIIDHWNRCVWCNSPLDNRLPNTSEEYRSMKLKLTSRAPGKQLSPTEQAILDSQKDWFDRDNFEVVFSEVEGDQE